MWVHPKIALGLLGDPLRVREGALDREPHVLVQMHRGQGVGERVHLDRREPQAPQVGAGSMHEGRGNAGPATLGQDRDDADVPECVAAERDAEADSMIGVGIPGHEHAVRVEPLESVPVLGPWRVAERRSVERADNLVVVLAPVAGR